ncbi:MAG: hypothetical protein V3571_05555 [Pseudodesulfovibrio sp.]
MHVDHTGFEPPNRHESVQAFHAAAQATAGDEWPRLDAEARDAIDIYERESRKDDDKVA